ncbi:MAG: hypothetical protein ACFFDH_17775 [Promethearchaeota archaeon]
MYVLLLIILIHIILIVCLNFWDGGEPVKRVENYIPHYYSLGNYGVHDHIARGALYLLVQKDPFGCLNSLINDNGWSWLLYLENYLYFGTEVPDTGTQEGLIDGIDISNENRPDNNKFKDAAKHHVYFKLGEEINPYSYSSAIRALRIAEEVRWAIEQRRCKYATYLLGAMCHYISDPTSYWHTGDNETIRSYYHDRNHFRFEKSADRRVKYEDPPSIGVFEFQSLLDNIDNIVELNPIDATIYAAWDTYWDLDYINEYPYDKGIYNHHWMNKIDQKKKNSIKVWDRAKRSIHSAMFYCAKAIKRTVGEYFKCFRNYEETSSRVKWDEIERINIGLFTAKYSFKNIEY